MKPIGQVAWLAFLLALFPCLGTAQDGADTAKVVIGFYSRRVMFNGVVADSGHVLRVEVYAPLPWINGWNARLVVSKPIEPSQIPGEYSGTSGEFTLARKWVYPVHSVDLGLNYLILSHRDRTEKDLGYFHVALMSYLAPSLALVLRGEFYSPIGGRKPLGGSFLRFGLAYSHLWYKVVSLGQEATFLADSGVLDKDSGPLVFYRGRLGLRLWRLEGGAAFSLIKPLNPIDQDDGRKTRTVWEVYIARSF